VSAAAGQSIRKVSTHRVLQLSTMIERLHAVAGQCSRAAGNAADIGNRTMAIRLASRAMTARSIAEYAGKVLAVRS
jgi:hypothetical protein